jgi:hypothetical protein
VICAIVLVALVAVPVGWALLSSVWETPKQFLNDPSQPPRAKLLIRWGQQFERVFPGYPGGRRLAAISHLMSAPTPEGNVEAYALRFSGRGIGFALLDFGRYPGVPLSFGYEREGPTGLARRCPRDWALQYLIDGGTSLAHSRSNGYILGRAAAKVASIHVLYPDGTTTRGTVANGYFFVWIKHAAETTNVTLLAANRTGETVGRLVVGGYGGRPFRPSELWSPFICVP